MTDIFIPKKPPLFTRVPTPLNFKTSYDRQKYWAKEKKKWIEGVDSIPGTLYHYWQEQKLKARTGGKTIRPLPREADLIIHQKIRECRDILHAHLLVYKCRGIGLSTLIGSLCNYFMRAYPGSTSLITSADQARIAKLYTDKIKVAFENYHPDIRYDISKRNETTIKTYLQIAIKYLDEYGLEQITYSDIHCNQTSDSDEAAMSFSGTGAIFGGYDEGPLNKRITKLLRSSEECYRNQTTGQNEGFLLVGGTIEQQITPAQLHDFQELIANREVFKMEEMFIPYNWKYHDDNGYFDFERAKVLYDEEYERKAKSGDPNDLISFKKNNPTCREDLFDLAAAGIFEQDVAEKIKVQYREVINEQPVKIPSLPYIITDVTGAMEAVPDKKSKTDILEMPKPGCNYYVCIDGVATGKRVSGEEGSYVASIVMKMFDPSADSFSYMPVCVYYERPESVEQSYYKITNQGKFYNKFGGLKGFAAEANASTADHFSTHLEKEGLSRYIMMRKDLSGKGYSSKTRVFQYITKEARDYQIRMANPFLRKYIQGVRHKKLLQDLMKSDQENADLRDAFFMFFIAIDPDFDKPIIKTQQKYISSMELRIGPNGTYWEEVKRPVKSIKI